MSQELRHLLQYTLQTVVMDDPATDAEWATCIESLVLALKAEGYMIVPVADETNSVNS